MITPLLILVAVVMLAATVVFLLSLINVPEGTEDAEGFHRFQKRTHKPARRPVALPQKEVVENLVGV